MKTYIKITFDFISSNVANKKIMFLCNNFITFRTTLIIWLSSYHVLVFMSNVNTYISLYIFGCPLSCIKIGCSTNMAHLKREQGIYLLETRIPPTTNFTSFLLRSFANSETLES